MQQVNSVELREATRKPCARGRQPGSIFSLVGGERKRERVCCNCRRLTTAYPARKSVCLAQLSLLSSLIIRHALHSTRLENEVIYKGNYLCSGSPLCAQDIIKISFMALKCFVCGLWVAFYLGPSLELLCSALMMLLD